MFVCVCERERESVCVVLRIRYHLRYTGCSRKIRVFSKSHDLTNPRSCDLKF